MKLRFTLKKLFRSYPITIVSILLLLISITTILIQSHVYAMSEKSNTLGCNCETHNCPKASDQPPSDPYHPDCNTQGTTCYCTRAEKFVHCERNYYNRCEGEIKSGCDAGEPCSEDNCNISSGCGGEGCPGPLNCGACKIFVLDTDPDKSFCYKSYPFCSETYMGCLYKFSEYLFDYLP